MYRKKQYDPKLQERIGEEPNILDMFAKNLKKYLLPFFKMEKFRELPTEEKRANFILKMLDEQPGLMSKLFQGRFAIDLVAIEKFRQTGRLPPHVERAIDKTIRKMESERVFEAFIPFKEK